MIKKAKKSNSKISQISTGVLVLENKKVFKGIGIGYQGEATGEVCFNTSLTGYQEIISDPSYAGQIINFTFPHIGNVGTNNEDYESDKIWTKGVIFNSEITSACGIACATPLAKSSTVFASKYLPLSRIRSCSDPAFSFGPIGTTT